VAAIRQAIADTADNGAAVDSLAELQTVVSTAAAAATTALGQLSAYDGTGAAPTDADFRAAGLSGVTAPRLGAVLSALATLPSGATDTYAEVQAVIDAYVAVLAEATGGAGDATPGSNPTAATYALIGAGTAGALTPSGVSLLNDVVRGAPTSAVDTIPEIDAMAEPVQRVMQTVSGTQATSLLTVNDLTALGITGVTPDLLGAVQQALSATADDGSAVDTVGKLQAAVSAAVSAATVSLSRISGFTGSGQAPTAADFTAIGVTGVSADTLPFVLSAVAVLPSASTDTAADVQQVVDAVNSILAEATGGAGDPTPGSDPNSVTYARIGATTAAGLAGPALGLLNDVITASAVSAVDSVVEIDALAARAARVLAIASGTADGSSLTLDDLVQLGVSGVTATTMPLARQAIADTADDGSGIDSLIELRAVVTQALAASATAVNRLSGYEGSGTAPTTSDYREAGVTGVTPTNLASINSAIAALPSSQTDSIAELQGVVTAYVAILGEAVGGGADPTPFSQPSAATYATIGVVSASGLTASGVVLLNDVVRRSTLGAVDSVPELEALASVAARLIGVARGQQPLPNLTVAELTALGLTGISEARLTAILSSVASSADDGTGADTVAELQALVSATEAVGVTLTGATIVARNTPVTLTAQVVDSQGRPTALSQSVRFALSADGGGVTFAPASPVTLPEGATTATVTVQFSEVATRTVRMAWLQANADVEATGRTAGTHTVTVQRNQQTLTMETVPTQAVTNPPVTLLAAASSGLGVTLISTTPTVCAVSGTSVRLLGAGTCTVQASQAGNDQWQAAPWVSRSFSVLVPTVRLSATSTALTGDGGSGQISMTVSPDSTVWSAVSDAAWLTTSSTGVGSGTVQFTAAPNASATTRSGSITVGGVTHTVTQVPLTRLDLRVAEVRGTRVRLEWTHRGPATSGFVIEGDVVSGGRTAVLPVGSVTSFTLEVPAGRYFVRVRTAEDTALRTPSNEVPLNVVVPIVPSAPAQLVGSAVGSQLKLSWLNTYEGGEPTAVDVVVGGAVSTRVPVGVADRFEFNGVPTGTYTFQIVARNAVGESAPSNTVTLSFPGACAPPQVPTWLTHSVVNRLVTVSWAAPASGSAPTEYLVTAEGVGTFPTGGARSIAGTLGPGTYRVWVQAASACGVSAPSEVQTIVVP
jgi:hypothetical protein